MNRSSQSVHAALINAVAERYRLDGYEVVIEPEPNAVPFDLGGYRPDLIARNGGVTIIVEVKSEVQKLSFDQLRSLAEEVRRHEGWRFVLVTGQDVLRPGLPSQDEDQLTWSEVESQVEDARRLAEAGKKEAGYLILWIAFERMMRSQARSIALPVDRLAPAILIRQLYSQGELTISQLETALRCQEVRNRIVHGFRAPNLDTAAVDLSSIVRELLDQWSAVGSNDYENNKPACGR
jgi:hypothetical protein